MNSSAQVRYRSDARAGALGIAARLRRSARRARRKSCASCCSTRWAAASTATRRRGRRCCSTGRRPARRRRATATVWGEAAPSLRAADAALVNGTSIHAFELDDYHQAKLHPGAVVIPAAIAMAEKLDASGERLVTAIAAGYEVMIRTSLALNPSAARLRGWHLTGVCGPFGAAAACASLLGLDEEQHRMGARSRRHARRGPVGVQRRRHHEQALSRGKRRPFRRDRRGAGALGFTGPDADLRIPRRRRAEGVLRRVGPGAAHARSRRPLSSRCDLDQALFVLRQHAFLRRRRVRAAPPPRHAVEPAAARARGHGEGGGRAVRLRLRPRLGAERADEPALRRRGGAPRRPGAAAAVHRREDGRSRARRARAAHRARARRGARQALSRAFRRLGRGRRQGRAGCAWTCSIRWAPPPTRSTRTA